MDIAGNPATIHVVTIRPETSHLELASGLRLHCVHWGDPRGPDCAPIVLVHGLASNARLWDAAAGALARRGHGVVALDQRGHGRSDKPDDGYDMTTVVDDLAGALGLFAARDPNWAMPLVVGQSWGGNVVVELAVRHARLVRGVCAVDGGSIHLRRSFPDWEECARRLAPPHLVGTDAARLRAAIVSMHPDWPAESIDGVMHNMEIRGDGTVAPWLTFERHMKIVRALWEHSPAESYPSIEIPVMFAPAVPAGDGDLDEYSRAKRAQLDEASRLLRRCRIEPFVGADHDLHAQHPERFAAALDRAIGEGFFAPGVRS